MSVNGITGQQSAYLYAASLRTSARAAAAEDEAAEQVKAGSARTQVSAGWSIETAQGWRRTTVVQTQSYQSTLTSRNQTAQTAQNAAQTAAAGAVQTPQAELQPAENPDAASAEAAPKVDSFQQTAANATHFQPDMETVQRMKAETEARMQKLVTETLSRQLTGGRNSDIWSLLRNSGTRAEDILSKYQKQTAENDADDYWGVEQTSDRIVKMAQALTGGDPSKLDSMIQAFEKGFKAAEKAMGGSLPDISQRTRQAVLDKFQALKDQQVQQTQAVQNPNKSAAVSAAAGVS